MSTKNLKEALAMLREVGSEEMVFRADEALAELEAIEKAASDVTALTPGELLKEFEANPKNPLVLRWLDAAQFFAVIAGRMKMP